MKTRFFLFRTGSGFSVSRSYNKETAGNWAAGIVYYNDSILYYSDVYLEIYIPGIQNTGGDRSCHMDISGCKNCNMYVSTE